MPISENSVLIITGMHRSGTSLTASFLATLGVELGNNLLKGDYGNPQGYFEDVNILTFQRHLLASCCRRHEIGFPDWGWTESEWLNQQKIQSYFIAAQQLIQTRKPQSPIWGWKDPRTTLLLDFWHQIFPDAYYLLIYRYPWDVIDSILRLNIPFFQTYPQAALKIWRYYNLHLLDFYKRNSQRCLLVNINRLIQYPEIFLNLLNSKVKHYNFKVKLESNEQGKTLLQSIYNPKDLKSLPLNHAFVKLLFQTSSQNYFELLEQLDQVADLPSQFSKKLFLQEWESLETMVLKLYQHSIITQSHPNSPQFLHLVAQTAQNYKNNLESQLPLEELRQYRQKLAHFWLTVESIKEAYENWAGKVHKLFFEIGIKDEPLTESENSFVQQLLGRIHQETHPSDFLRYLLAVMLYQRPEKILINYDEMALPRWFMDDFLQFIFDLPRFFIKQEEIEEYMNYISNLMTIIESNLFNDRDSSLWTNIAKYFADLFNFLPLYFIDKNLKSLAIKRATILEYLLQKQGHKLDVCLSERPPNRSRIKIGILKSSFEITSETFTTVPVFELLNREKFEIIVYVLNTTENSIEYDCKNRVDQWVQLPNQLGEQVEVIRRDNLDILFIGSILTTAAQPIILLALHRLARIQATYFASPMTTGIRNLDYYVSGMLTEPPDAATHYREKLVLISGTGFCFNYNFEPIDTNQKLTRNLLGIPEEAVVFISGANFFKIIPNLRETWAKILASVPNSVLVLYPFGASWSKVYSKTAFIRNLHRVFEGYNVKPSRLMILDYLPNRTEVKGVLQLADVYLDSYPFSGANSLVDPLEVGLPSVTWEGNYLRSRQGAALMKDLGLFDLIADCESSYIKLGVSLGNNREFRLQTRQKIQQQMPPYSLPKFLDRQAYSAQIEAVFENLWQRYELSK